MKGMALCARLTWAAFTWVLYDVASYVLLIVPGYFIVTLAIACRRRVYSPVLAGMTIVNAPKWLWIWGNDEDGLEPAWYVNATPGWNKYVRMWVWAAWRNPANNLRFIKWLHPPPERGRIRIQRGTRWTLVWQGPFYRFSYYAPGWEFRIGWKYEVNDYVEACRDWRVFGCGFGTRFIKYK